MPTPMSCMARERVVEIYFDHGCYMVRDVNYPLAHPIAHAKTIEEAVQHVEKNYVSGKMDYRGYKASINLNAYRRKEVKQAGAALDQAGFNVSVTGEDAYCHEPFPQRR